MASESRPQDEDVHVRIGHGRQSRGDGAAEACPAQQAGLRAAARTMSRKLFDLLSRWRGLRTSLVVAFVSLVIGASWWSAAFVTKTSRELALQEGQSRADQASLAVAQFAGHMLDDARSFRDLAQRWLTLDRPENEPARREIQLAMQLMISQEALPVRSLAIFDASGQLLWHSAEDVAPFAIGDLEHFKAMRAGQPGPFAGTVQNSRGSGAEVMPVAWSLQDRQGGFGGIASIQFVPAALGRQLEDLVEQPGEVMALLRLQGEMLARSSTGGSNRARQTLRHDLLARLRDSGASRLASRADADGQAVLVTMRRLGNSNMVAATLVDEATALAGAERLALLAHIAAAAASLAAIAMVLIGCALLRSHRVQREAALLRAGRGEVERLHGRLPAIIFHRDVEPDGRSRLLYRAGDTSAVIGWPVSRLPTTDDWSDLRHPDTPPLSQVMLQALRRGTHTVRWKLRQPNGGWRTMQTRIDRIASRADGGGEVVGCILDVTAQAEAESRAEALRDELRSTLALAPVVVFRARLWSCADCRLPQGRGCHQENFISGSLESVTGWTEATLGAAGGLGAVLDGWGLLLEEADALRRDRARSADMRLRRPDGTRMSVRLSINVVEDCGPEALAVVGYMIDISQQRLAEARAIASARLASLGEMSAGLAHELKQPLQAISLAASNTLTAVRRGNAEGAEQRLQRIVQHAQRAANVIENLRRFARGSEEGAPPESLAVGDVIEGALAVLGGTLRDAGIELRVTVAQDTPRLLGQLVSLEQVLTNLMMNARDAMAGLPAGMERRIRLSAGPGPEPGTVEIAVADSGGGIPPQVMARLFEPFVTTKGEEHGTGLGLSICHGLIGNMGGRIRAANEGPGAVFRITLRAAPSGEPDVAARQGVADAAA
jgi:signal transduction histidine kinase